MDRGEGGDKVRPIDIGEVPETGLRASDDHADVARRRPIIPLAVSAGVIAVAVGVVGLFGSLEFADPPPQDPASFAARSGATGEDAAPPQTLPPRLRDALPDLTDPLTLVAYADGTLVTLLWDPAFRTPRRYELSPAVDGGADTVDASFDSGGRHLAVAVTASSGTDIWLGTPTNVGDVPDIESASSYAWHATEVASIAWVGRDDENGIGLFTANLNPLSGSLGPVTDMARFDGLAGIVRYDNGGFVVNEARSVRALDPNGDELWTTPGVAVAASESIITAIVPDDSAQTTRWVVLDRETGHPSQISGPPIDGAPRDVWVTTARDTNLIAAITPIDGRTSLRVFGPDLPATRIVQIDASVAPIGFAPGSEYFLVAPDDSNDVMFVSWRTGATRSVPVPDEYTVINLDLG